MNAKNINKIPVKFLGVEGPDEMSKYFEMVCDKGDWKAPINAYCRREDAEKVKEAIVFFTATEPIFMPTLSPGWVRVTAKGYREGPAGDY